MEQTGKIIEAHRGVGMLPTQHLLADCQRTLKKRPRRREIALVLMQKSKAVEARRGVGMVGTQHLSGDRQRALKQRPCRREVAMVLRFLSPNWTQAGEQIGEIEATHGTAD